VRSALNGLLPIQEFPSKIWSVRMPSHAQPSLNCDLRFFMAALLFDLKYETVEEEEFTHLLQEKHSRNIQRPPRSSCLPPPPLPKVINRRLSQPQPLVPARGRKKKTEEQGGSVSGPYSCVVTVCRTSTDRVRMSKIKSTVLVRDSLG